MVELIWLVPALPLAGFVVLLLLGQAPRRAEAGWLATVTAGCRSSASVVVFVGLVETAGPPSRHAVRVGAGGGLSVDVGFLLDPLSMTMILFVTGVGSLIHLYSIGYMHGDSQFPRFFAYLNLFAVLDADARPRRQPAADLPGLGGRGRLLLLPHRVLVRAGRRRRGRQEGLHHQPGRRLGIHGRHLPDLYAFGTLDFFDALPRPSRRTGQDHGHPHRAHAVDRRPSASRPVPLHSGCPMPWRPHPVSALIHAATMVTAWSVQVARCTPLFALAPGRSVCGECRNMP